MIEEELLRVFTMLPMFLCDSIVFCILIFLSELM
jgi:hypothetical protein